DMIRAGGAQLVIAGGMESMSNAPYLLARARSGYRAGHDRLLDHIYLDGLEDAYEPGRLMGVFADEMASSLGFSRADQDTYAAESLRRAQAAVETPAFTKRMAPVATDSAGQAVTITRDELPQRLKPERIASLKPVFGSNGTITAATASGLADGAAAVVLSSADEARRMGAAPLARVMGHASHAQEPSAFTTAPVGAVRRLLDLLAWRVADVDLFEINEAFAMVPMALMAELGVSHNRLNIHGGACALGHPIGASGARILVDLLHDLIESGGRRGVASLCIGGGEATAIAVERL
ncbi:MAG: acetyl-CoA C-acyltransferase, partial [Alphaproteobacteria bacterium]